MTALHTISRDARVQDLYDAGYRIHSTLGGWAVMRCQGKTVEHVGTRANPWETLSLAESHRNGVRT